MNTFFANLTASSWQGQLTQLTAKQVKALEANTRAWGDWPEA